MNEFNARLDKIPKDPEHYAEAASYINSVKDKMDEDEVGGMVSYELGRLATEALARAITCTDVFKLPRLMGIVHGIDMCRQQIRQKYPNELQENQNEVPPPQ